MKYALILLAFAASVVLSACLPEDTPPIVQVIAGPAGAPGATGATGARAVASATGDDGAKGDAGRPGDTVAVLPQRQAPNCEHAA